jgi:subtilisin family serine protease
VDRKSHSIAIVVLVAAFLFGAAAEADLLPVGPGVFVLKNQLEMEFAPAADVDSIAVVNGVPQTGVASVDRLLVRYGAAFVEPMFPGADPNDAVDLSRFYLVTLKEDLPNILSVVEEFRADGHVAQADPNYVHEIYYTPNDPNFPFQWALKHMDNHDVDADLGWDINKGSSSLAVAIADTGVDYEHPDLKANIWYNLAEKNGRPGIDDDGNGYVDDDKGWDWVDVGSGWPGEDLSTPDNDPMDFYGHGTHCSGIASAVTDNGEGMSGVAFKAKIMCLRIGWAASSGGQERGFVGMSYAAQALRYAADKGAVAFNCSWGSSDSGGLGAAVDYALSKGVLICSAAGNSPTQIPSYLGSRNDVIAVAATNVYGMKTSWSNYGTWVDVCAPGEQIWSTVRVHYGDHTYAMMSGTSMACPHVVGLAALVRASHTAWRWSEIKKRIEETCVNIDSLNPGYEGKLGSGLINCYRALAGNPGVDLLSFTARPRDGAVAVRWVTGSEYDHAGFNLYCRVKGEGEYAKLNEALITGASPYVYVDAAETRGVTLQYLLEDVSLGGTATRHGPVECDLPGGTGPKAYAFSRPSPNPARGAVNFTYALPAGHVGGVDIGLFDLSGRRVASVPDAASGPGVHGVTLNVASLAPGVYLCNFRAGEFGAAKRVVVAR